MFYDADIVHKKCHKREWERLKRDFRLLKRRKKDRWSQKCFYFQGRLFILPTPTLSTSNKLADLKTDAVSLWKYNEMHLLCCLEKDAGISESSATVHVSVGSESVSRNRGSIRPRPQLLSLSVSFFFFSFFFTHHPPLRSCQQHSSWTDIFSPPFSYSAGRLTATDISKLCQSTPSPNLLNFFFCGTYLCKFFQPQLKGQSDQRWKSFYSHLEQILIKPDCLQIP